MLTITFAGPINLTQALAEIRAQFPQVRAISRNGTQVTLQFVDGFDPPSNAAARLRTYLQDHKPDAEPAERSRPQLRAAIKAATTLEDLKTALLDWLDRT